MSYTYLKLKHTLKLFKLGLIVLKNNLKHNLRLKMFIPHNRETIKCLLTLASEPN